MFTKLKAWFIGLLLLLNIIKPAPSAAKEERLLKLDLQFFAGEGDESDEEDDQDESDEEEDDDDTPNLDELLKNPKFKKQFTDKTKGIVNKRLKKYEGIDPEELRQLKEKAGKKGKSEDDPDKDETRNVENEKRLLRAERREKTAIVKEFAIDNGYNPKLAARLMKVDAIELDEDGNAENLEELFEELEEEFPEYFSQQDDTDDDEEKAPPKKKGTVYNSGPRQKGNKKPPKVDPREAGRLKALERHKKKEG